MYLEYIWTKRMKWILRNNKKKSCIFCDIVKGKEKSFILKKGKIYVIMNKFPYNTGHLLIFPKKHVENFEDLKDEEIFEIFSTVKKSIVLLKRSLKPEGLNIGINLGEIASVSIPHLHIHIVPRFKRDVGFMEVVSSTKVMPEALNETYKKLKKHLKLIE